MSHTLVTLSAIILLVSFASAQSVCPDLTVGQGCLTGNCQEGKLHKNLKWNIPTGVPLLTGYGTAAFYLRDDIPDDTKVANSTFIRVTQRRNFTTCCRKCKKASYGCKFFQFLNLGSYGGLCFIYTGKKPFCNDSMLVKSKAGAKCQNSSIQDDPHLTGAHGTKYDFSGTPGKSYCLISDKELNVNMKMTGYLDNRTESATLITKEGKAVRTWVRELGITWKVDKWESHSLRMVARSGSRVERGEGYMAFIQYNDDEILPKLNIGEKITREGELTVTFVAVEKKGPYDVDYYRVTIGDLLDMDVRVRVAHPLLRTPDDAEAHISMGFNYIKNTPKIHGVLGQTYRAGRESRAIEFQKLTSLLHHNVGADTEEGKGFLDGSAEDYVTTSVMAPDCKYSAYQGYASDLVLDA